MKEYTADNANCTSWTAYKYPSDSPWVAPDDIRVGMYIGIAICCYHYTGYSDDSSPDRYTAPEIFKVTAGVLAKSNFWGEKEYRYTLETPEGSAFTLFCRQRKETDTLAQHSPALVFESGRYIETKWFIEETLVRWIENDLYTQNQRGVFSLIRYKDALSVKNAILALHQYREESKREYEEAQSRKKAQQAQERNRAAEKERQDREAAAELEDLWRKR